ncbi:hypothetical protein [Streptomyces sp.]
MEAAGFRGIGRVVFPVTGRFLNVLGAYGCRSGGTRTRDQERVAR